MASPLPLPPPARNKFSVYQNAAITSALAARSLRPSLASFVFILIFAFGSSLSLVAVVSRKETLVSTAMEMGVAQSFACYIIRILQSLLVIMFLAAMSALCKALSLQASADANSYATAKSGISHAENNAANPEGTLTEHHQALLGTSTGGKHTTQVSSRELASDTPKHRTSRNQTTSSPSASSQSTLLVPVHQTMSLKSGRGPGSSFSRSGLDWHEHSASNVSPMAVTSTGLQVSPFQSSSYMSPPQKLTPPDDLHLSPWAKQASPVVKEDITNEEKLEEFLADVEDKLAGSTVKTPTTVQALLTPPPTVRGVGIATPTSALTPSTTPQTTSARSLRISPNPQKFGGSPRKGDNDLLPPMSMEQATEGFQKLGVYPQIETWRDLIRQWFSKDLLDPLVVKIDSSHMQVMQAVAKLGITVNISPVGGSKSDAVIPSQSLSTDTLTHEWVTTFAPDEDALLHQLRAFLMQARDAPPTPQPSIFGLQPQAQVRQINPVIQECLDAVSEHQRLKALIKGEWAKGLLPQSSVRADYTVQRIRELAEGTCVKKYEYLANGEIYDKISKRWTLELPTDSHLLIYLFCALLEHPNWMLHIDPSSQPSTQTANNPLFIANLPQKERCPEKYLAVLSSPPPILHSGACILVVGKQNPPVFALYWDKKVQFSLQGRTAMWDATLLFCYRIKVAYGGVVQGINLGSSAFNLLTIFEAPKPDDIEE